MKWFLKCWRQYADFSSRARRKEYWMFYLFNVLIIFFLNLIDHLIGVNFIKDMANLGKEVVKETADFEGVVEPNVIESYQNFTTSYLDIIAGSGYGILSYIYALAIIIPIIAVSVRRLHDIGKSGWMYLVFLIPIAGPIWLLVLLCTNSQPGANKWGDNPKQL